MGPEGPDYMAVGDLATLQDIPWMPGYARIICNGVVNKKPYPYCSRVALQTQIERLTERGLTLYTGIEPEFMLLTRRADGSLGPADPTDTLDKPCYDYKGLFRTREVLDEMVAALRAVGIDVYQIDHEDGNGQFEMNWEYDRSLVTADRHAFFKYMVKAVAERHGLRATFMPKPFLDRTGSGCHTHVSVWHGEKNLFEDAADKMGLSALGYQFLGGIMHNADALCALLNPTVNSYKRINAPVTLSGATWSPNMVTFSGDNRTHMIRIPAPGRFELRLADGSVNPYLLPAAVLAAGMDGASHERHPGEPLDLDMYAEGHKAPAETKRLPLNLLDSLRALAACAPLREALGAGFIDSYVKLRTAEWNEYARHLTDWERANTLDC
jgi:glutamine synthetase